MKTKKKKKTKRVNCSRWLVSVSSDGQTKYWINSTYGTFTFGSKQWLYDEAVPTAGTKATYRSPS